MAQRRRPVAGPATRPTPESLTASAAGPLWRARARATPWWVMALLIWAASRVLTTTLVLLAATLQAPNAWTGARPAYAAFAGMWDGHWYNIAAVVGYPTVLPVTDGGEVGENVWAFMPGYPALVRLLMELTGQPWPPTAVVVSVAFSAGTALLFGALMRRVLPASTAMFAVLLFCVSPLSPLLQFAYAESMNLFFLTLGLLLLLQRRYAVMFPVIAVMALTRPTGLAFALALALHVGVRFATRQRDPFPLRERMLAASVAVFSGVMGLAWPIAAWARTGVLTAYTDTELAWRSPYIGYQELIPFTAWFQSGDWWLGQPLGTLVVIVLIVGFGMLLFTPAVRRLGVDLRLWVASYGLYLLAVFFPQSSVFRLLMPMFPLLGAAAVPRNRLYRVAVVALCLLGQWGWLLLFWRVDGADWTPP